MKILHVTAALGGGVATAIGDYLASTPSFEHWLLGTGPPELHQCVRGLNGEMIPLPTGHFARGRAVHHWVKTLKPDLVHAHSSYAGLYTRLLPLPGSTPTVYTPHCYGFERTDLGLPTRLFLWSLEAALSWRGGLVAAASAREARLAARLPGRIRIVRVPPTFRGEGSMQIRPREDSPSELCEVVMVGRACPQKDPGTFAAAAKIARASGSRTKWTWVGSGSSPSLQRLLNEAGVTVTGWLPREDVLKYVARAGVYVHTAAWEAGVPLALLEAANAGLPVLARNISAMSDLKICLFENARQLADLVSAACISGPMRAQMVERSIQLAQDYPPKRQEEALRKAYELAARGSYRNA